MFSCTRRIKKHFQVGAPNFYILVYFKRSFPLRIILNNIKNEKDSRGSGGMFPRKIFENSPSVVVVLILFEHISGKFWLSFLLLVLSVSQIMMHFVHTFSIMRA